LHQNEIPKDAIKNMSVTSISTPWLSEKGRFLRFCFEIAFSMKVFRGYQNH
jgi:hypothetical protein